MKKFIKHKLRLVLEGKKATHSPSNPVGQDPKNATQSNLARTTHKIVSLNDKYGQDSYFQNTHEGDGVYMATIHTNGNITIKTPNTKRKLEDNDIGLLSTGNGGNKHVVIRAYRGIEHPELQKDRTGNVRSKSPAEDAAIKTYLIFAKDILEFVKQNMDGESSYTTDDKDFKPQTDTKNQYKYAKHKREKQMKRSTLTTDPDKAAEREKKQAELQAKIDKMKKRRGQ